jgi:Uma2 family endonuclease
MATQTPQAEVDETEVLDPESLFRMPRKVYEAIVKHGVLSPRDRVALVDGLLVQEETPLPQSAEIESERLYRMPLEVYHAIAEHGLLTPRDKVVLLDGLLVKKMTRGAPHVTVTQRIVNALNGFALVGWYIRKEEPITVPGKSGGRESEPEPDVAVVQGHFENYALRHPGPAEVAFVVEVAATSLRKDRKSIARYARAGIPVAWLVDLSNRTIEVSTNPTGRAERMKYDVKTVYGPGDRIPVVIEGREVGQIAVSEILP